MILILANVNNNALAVEESRKIDFQQNTPSSLNSTGFQEYKNPFISQLPQKEKEEKKEETIGEEPKLEIEWNPEATISLKEEKPPTPIITPPELNIVGLVWNSDRPQAIVNDQIVGVGDSIMGADIVAIHRNGIEISYEGIIFTIDPEGKSSKKEGDSFE